MSNAQRGRRENEGSISALPMVVAGIINALFLLFPFWPAELWIFPLQFSKEGVLIPSLIILAVGALIFFSAVASLRRGYFGSIQPSTSLVSSGIYRYIRHPMYVSYAVAMLGIDLLSRNLFGFFFTFLAFIPTMIYRAHCEEKALAHRFGQKWSDYVLTSGFFLPKIRKAAKRKAEKKTKDYR